MYGLENYTIKLGVSIVKKYTYLLVCNFKLV